MTKKVYMQPTIALDEFDMEELLLAYSVKSVGLDNEEIKTVEETGDTWDDAMSRKAWDDDEEY